MVRARPASVVALVVVALCTLVGCGGGSSSSTCPAAPTGTTAPFVAADAFAVRCAGCHGALGSGGVGPKLAGGAVVRAFPNAADQVKFVCNGRGGMPAFKTRNLNIDQARAIVEYTRTDLARR